MRCRDSVRAGGCKQSLPRCPKGQSKTWSAVATRCITRIASLIFHI